MIRKLELSTVSILLFILIVNTSADGQNRSVDNNSLLWEISGNDLEKPSYLFGTIHMIPKKDYFFTEAMKDKFDSSSALVLEMKLNIPLKEQIKIAGKTLLPGNKTLRDYMNDVDYNLFITFLSDSLNIKKRKIKKYVRLKPFFSSALIVRELIGRVVIYEKKLHKAAKRNRIPIVGLESIYDQLDVVEQFTIPEQVSLLWDETTTKADIIQEFDEMIRLYKNQDITGLYDLVAKEEGFPDFKSRFISGRNKTWVPRIKTIIHKKNSFIAVGAGHLWGDEGLISLLKKEGYVVRPVK